MALNCANIVIAGNLVADPEDRTGSNGRPFAIMRVASDRRWLDEDGNWQSTDSLFIDVQLSGSLASHCLQSLCKGAPVVVQGRLFTSSWVGINEDGSKTTRSTMKVRASNVGLDLNRIIVKEAVSIKAGEITPLPIGGPSMALASHATAGSVSHSDAPTQAGAFGDGEADGFQMTNTDDIDALAAQEWGSASTEGEGGAPEFPSSKKKLAKAS